MGRYSAADWLRARLSRAGRCRSGRCAEQKSGRNGRLRTAGQNLRWADAPGNVLLPARTTSLSKDSVANVSRIVALDKALLTERVGKLSDAKVELLLAGIDVVLGG